MAIEVVMPQLGLTMTEGAVNRWLKLDGEAVEKGEALFEVSTDKVEMEVEADHSGHLQILLEPERTVPVGAIIALLHPGGERAAVTAVVSRPAPAQAPVSESPVPARIAPREGKVAASPRAKALARRLGVDIHSVAPARPGARIVEADVRKAYGAAKPALATTPAKAMAARLEESFRAPHFYLHSLSDAEKLHQLRLDLLGEIESRTGGLRLTYTDLLIRALALAMGRHPEVNASWQDGDVARWTDLNIGVAVQAGDRLVVPVLRDAGRLSLPQITQARAALVEKARSGRLTLADLEGGRTTLSNLGPFGVDSFSPILNPPQSSILAVGKIARRPFVIDDGLAVRWTVGLTFSFDHRVVDGAAGASLLRTLVEYVENPARLLLD
jgi:pyruvate dehydrogenase E2 component (dihydrolipoyllysine-residue acetyltransferase)